jgi:hypothetical protein
MPTNLRNFFFFLSIPLFVLVFAGLGCTTEAVIAARVSKVDRKPASDCSYFALPVQIMKKKADCPSDTHNEYISVDWEGVLYCKDLDGVPCRNDEKKTMSVTIDRSNQVVNQPVGFDYPKKISPLKIDAMRILDAGNLIDHRVTKTPDSHPTGFSVSAWSDCHLRHQSSILDPYNVYVDHLAFEPCERPGYGSETACAKSYVYNDLVWIQFEVIRACH